tara:strand:- start:44 stop:238 length:195 start_codon:yes stop_codon:yes gene_type:complete
MFNNNARLLSRSHHPNRFEFFYSLSSIALFFFLMIHNFKAGEVESKNITLQQLKSKQQHVFDDD